MAEAKDKKKDRSTYKVIVGDCEKIMRFERRGNLENTVKEAVKEYLTHYKLIGMNGAKVIVYQVLEKGTEASVISDSIADFIKEAVLEHQGT